MSSLLEFVMVSCLFADLAVRKGAAVFTWLKGEVKTVEKKL
jgi:hypothetical protein